MNTYRQSITTRSALAAVLCGLLTVACAAPGQGGGSGIGAKPILDATKIVGQKLDIAEKTLGKPYHTTEFETRIPGIRSYKVPKLGEVHAAPASVAAFEDGWVEFRFAKGTAKDPQTALKLIGLQGGKAVDGGWTFPSLKGWKAEWNDKPQLGDRGAGVNALTFKKDAF